MSVNLDFVGNTQELVNGVNKATTSMKDLNEETKSFDNTSKKAFDEASKGAEEFNKDLDDNVKKTNQTVKTIDSLNKEFAELKTKRNAAFDTKELNAFNRKLQETEKEINQLTNAGKQGFDEMGDAINDSGSKFDGMLDIAGGIGIAFGAEAIIGGVIAIGSAVVDTVSQFRELRGAIQFTTGATGGELDMIAERTTAIGKTFDQDVNQVMVAANVLAKEFGLTNEEALDKLQAGLLGSAGDTGELIEQVKEYSGQIAAAGGGADELFQIVNKSAQEGIFSDKGIDVVKEFGLRIREQTSATSDALNNAFGKEFTDKIFNGINDGSLSSVDSLKLISEQLNDTSIPASKLQTVIADVFGGPGEDAGLRYLQSLKDINGSVESLVDNSVALTREQQSSLAAQENLAAAQNELSQLFDDVAGGGAILTNLQAIGFQFITSFIEPFLDLFQDLGDAFSPLFDSFSKLGDSLGIAGEGFDYFQIVMFPVNALLKTLGFTIEVFAKALGFVVDGITDFVNKTPFVRDAINFISDAIDSAVETFNQFKDLFTSGFDSFAAAGKTVARAFDESFTQPMIKQVGELDSVQRERLKQQLLRDQKELLSRLQVLQAQGELVSKEGQLLLEKAKAQQNILNEIKNIDTAELNAKKQVLADKEKAEKEAEAKRLAGIKAANDKNKGANEKAAADRKKLQEDLNKSLEKLEDDAEKISIDRLEGKEKINAIRDAALEEINVLEQSIIDKGKLLDKEFELTAEQSEQLDLLRSEVNVKAFNERKKFAEEERKQKEDNLKKSLDLQEKIDIEEINLLEDDNLRPAQLEELKQEAILNIQRDYAQKRLDLLEGVGGKEAELQRLQLQGTINDFDKQLGEIDAKKGKFSFAKAIGVTDDEFEAIKPVLKQAASQVLSAVSDSIGEQIAANEELIGGIEDKIDATEEALDRELELNKQGFASNVDGKREELEALKKQREDALKQQEELQKKQLLLDSAIQLSSMITSAAQIFKSLSPIPFVGVPLAIGLIATMFGAFALAKVSAYQSISAQAKLEEGGTGTKSGIIKGRRHSHGGERFLDHVEVEDGEQWSVFNRGATNKHGGFISGITDLINKGDRRVDLIDDLLFGTGVMRAGIDKELEGDKNIIVRQERIIIANLTSDKMVDYLRSVDGGVSEIIKMNKLKSERWEDSSFIYERKGGVTKKVKK